MTVDSSAVRARAVGRRPERPSPELYATARGASWPLARWCGRVAGIFTSAISVLHEDGFVASVLRGGRRMEPHGLALAEEDFDALRRFLESRSPNAEVDADRDAVVFAGTARLSLESAELRDEAPSLREAAALAAAATADRAQGTGSAVAAMIAARRPGGMHGDGPFARAFARLSRAEGFPANLVGFGPGTTPSGDDFIAGWLLGHGIFGGGGKMCSPAGFDLSKTTPAGRSVLLAALAGHWSRALAEFALAFARASVGRGGMEDEAREVLAHGASSGADALLGFLHGAFPDGVPREDT